MYNIYISYTIYHIYIHIHIILFIPTRHASRCLWWVGTIYAAAHSKQIIIIYHISYITYHIWYMIYMIYDIYIYIIYIYIIYIYLNHISYIRNLSQFSISPPGRCRYWVHPQRQSNPWRPQLPWGWNLNSSCGSTRLRFWWKSKIYFDL